MYRILVTGGSGFIGTNLVEFYLQKGIDVINFDIAPPLNYHHRTQWEAVDLLDLKKLQDKLLHYNPTHIVHLAARTDLGGTSLDAYNVNTVGTENLIAASRTAKNLEKILFASTMLVCKTGHIPATHDEYNPTTIYGESKVRMEQFIKSSQLACQYNIVRPTSIWGPWFQTPYKDFFDTVYRKRFINIAKRACNKTYGFVLNSVYQIDKILFDNSINGRTFYIGDSPSLNIAEWADEIATQMGYNKPKQLPYNVFRVMAIFGDTIKIAGINFPLTSFRLKNMTTDNVIRLDDLIQVTGPTPYTTKEGIGITLKWLNYK